MSIEPRAFGFESEQALIEVVRARLGVPADCGVVVSLGVVGGQAILTLVVTGRGCAHTASHHDTR